MSDGIRITPGAGEPWRVTISRVGDGRVIHLHTGGVMVILPALEAHKLGSALHAASGLDDEALAPDVLVEASTGEGGPDRGRQPPADGAPDVSAGAPSKDSAEGAPARKAGDGAPGNRAAVKPGSAEWGVGGVEATDAPGFRHVGYRNPRTGVLHKLKLDLSPGADWERLYVEEIDP